MLRSALPSRREFLYGTAAAAASVLLAACSSSSSGGGSDSGSGSGSDANGASASRPRIGGKSGSATKPLPKPASFTEAPSLRGRGLPPVAERLPKNPYVVPHHWVERGKYGGSLQMPVFGTTGMSNADSTREFFYGYSPTRWLNDGLDIGPGLADRWSSNKDATQWTVHFREGLKWSDGQPFSVDDVLFWWDDMVVPAHNAQTPPADCLSAARHVCTMKKVDDYTLRITYDAPQPMLPAYLASWVKGNIGRNGPAWMYPKHYMKQFHPKYNKNVPKDWDSAGGLWEQKADWIRNPDCPTLAGYRCKKFDNDKGSVLERNPYYYAVTKEGDQLPYIDEIVFTIYQDPQVLKLQVQQGKTDYCHGSFNQIDLSDVSTLSRFAKQNNYRIELWDSGSGTASMFFLNYDYPDKKYRDLFRDKRFRQAISHCFDRPTARKTLYFQTGEITTGSMGPKAPEFHAQPDGPSMYKQWRDSYSSYDPQKAKALFRQIGLKDTNGDGYLEFADGSKLTVEIPYSADIDGTGGAKDDLLVANAKKVGLRMVRRPVPPQAFGDQWTSGQLMSHTNWEVSNGDLMIASVWLLPIESARWAPLEGQYYSQLGTAKERQEQNVDPWHRHPPRLAPEAGGPIAKMWQLYEKAKRTPDQLERYKLIWDIMKIHVSDGPFFMGTVANYPQPIIVDNDLRNVPTKQNLAQGGLVNDWELPCPAVYDPEVYYWQNPEQHTA